MAKIVQTGNSLAVTIPAKFAKQIGIKLGDEVELQLQPESGRLTIFFKTMRQLPLLNK